MRKKEKGYQLEVKLMKSGKYSCVMTAVDFVKIMHKLENQVEKTAVEFSWKKPLLEFIAAEVCIAWYMRHVTKAFMLNDFERKILFKPSEARAVLWMLTSLEAPTLHPAFQLKAALHQKLS